MNKKTIISAFVYLLFLAAFFASTNPETLPIVFLVLPFFALYGLVYNLLIITTSPLSITKTKKKFTSHYVASVVVGATVLSSLGQFTIRDVTLLLLFSFILILYVYRTDIIN